ncbi:MAG: DUF6776 family protein [Pseudomonadota bacterium]
MLVLVCLIVLAATGYGLYDYGRYRGGFNEELANQRIDELEQEIEELSRRNQKLLDQNALLDRSSRIDRNAHDEVKAALNIAQQQSLELREELAFFRSLVSPSEMEPGMHIQNFSVEQDAEPGSFNYKLVLTQVRKNNREAVGRVLLRFSGLINGKSVIYALSDIAQVKTEDLNFKFKYFQSFEGSLRFPKRFQPKSVSITVRPEGERLKSVQKTLEWDSALTRS